MEKDSRYSGLKKLLIERRQALQSEVRGKMREVRTMGANVNQGGVPDEVEISVADGQKDLDFALIQMKSETLNRVNGALVRLEQGGYGNCSECGEEIAERRLRALPFAVRCKDCEEAREVKDADIKDRINLIRRVAGNLSANTTT